MTSDAQINPILVLGQVEGSIYMGLGEALMEEQNSDSVSTRRPACSTTRVRPRWTCATSKQS